MYILRNILNSTKDCMEWDDDLQQYSDRGSFMLSLDKDEYDTLMKIKL